MRGDLRRRELALKRRVEPLAAAGDWRAAARLAGELVLLYGELQDESPDDAGLRDDWRRLQLKWESFERQFLQRAER